MKVYIGIDIHQSFHKVAIVSRTLMASNSYHKLQTLKVTSCREDFNKLIAEIQKYGDVEVIVGVDHTREHYSAPLLTLLYQQGYTIYSPESKGFKVQRRNLLGVDNKTDSLDAISMARLLWLRDTTGDNYRFTTTQPD